MKANGKTVSLNAELATLGEALDAAMILADALQNEGFSTEYEQQRAPGAISAVLSLVAGRLKNLGQLVRGTLDAEGFWTRRSAGPIRHSECDEADVLIPTTRSQRSKSSSK